MATRDNIRYYISIPININLSMISSDDLVLSAHTKRTIYYNGPELFNKFCTSPDFNCSIHTFKKHLKEKMSLTYRNRIDLHLVW